MYTSQEYSVIATVHAGVSFKIQHSLFVLDLRSGRFAISYNAVPSSADVTFPDTIASGVFSIVHSTASSRSVCSKTEYVYVHTVFLKNVLNCSMSH